MLAAVTTVIAGATFFAGPAAYAAEAALGPVSQSIPKALENSLGTNLFDELDISLDNTIKEAMTVPGQVHGLGAIGLLFDEVDESVGSEKDDKNDGDK